MEQEVLEVRKSINNLRVKGYPICSSYNGYFYSTNPEDIRKTVNSLYGRISSISKACEGLLSISFESESGAV